MNQIRKFALVAFALVIAAMPLAAHATNQFTSGDIDKTHG